MQHVESMCKLCAVLNRIEETGMEVAILLYLYGYDKRPDIVDPDTSLVRAKVSVDFDTEAAQEILQKVCEEQKEKGHPEVAVKAMELCHRLIGLENELETSQNMY